ncbi:MAG: bifunctional glutamate N-acetyltransferase/amino-acid acetyltransferase ArgJ [Helicobacter sp.]|uniref:bifunctional glutamate N-acetyltransferase/amino-acid acetyltransferase ArgJ n=1 Tax=Helicobacter sp. 10-6591 TaxID=2004998 RepID=UPI000DCF2EB8|nr:bifunctional glutamate N-acetyltransferase/amino-acid acetyltransferase ArgJ [Helicobacter sp. 10-6591]MCI6217849.1 bifunctional glutamate N-acetyltransferase/amino-acid acetyltransferase ArgJ [Helicobacter sp.]MCI7485293.1 bifunctional glutamate N-acetyltransferase/amino-acid acetyltransferase ArgJ [Helicobacter sp.]MDD7567605.1 bifunctional glutamate N-acetyltransferase/amino-acid acetyltransferase ArgJ [Helicobacter sp.]MDY5740932.1 bifunctional glutamate N-acetyltransferase/amino-acid ac
MRFEIYPIDGGVCAAEGFVADGVSVGLKDNALDVAFIYAKSACRVNAVFTKNTFAAAPIVHFKRFVQNLESNFVLITTKNANAMTGEEGVKDINEILCKLQERFAFVQNPIMSSTGVIGVRLPKEKIIDGFSKFVFDNLDTQAHKRASEAIKTTDSFSKEIAFRVCLADGKSFHIGAMAKGAGMIAPSLATMLCFITTDADISHLQAQELLEMYAKKNFDSISVDGDMSTNDSVFLLSNGKSGVFDREAFSQALDMLMHKLALDIVRDGEGSSKLVAFEVRGAINENEAKLAAKALSNSLLVKTALFGRDPNWGRIASTIGASGVNTSQEDLSISIGGIYVFQKGVILFTPEVEAKATKALESSEIKIVCDLGKGDGSYTSYGCDLGYKYVEINSDYRS